ncbi:MAG: tetratricopeptide repeat protein [Pseudolabrys sp.]
MLLNHGLILDALKRHEEAVESFDAALKLKSKYAEAHNNRGATLVTLGRDQEGLESCPRRPRSSRITPRRITPSNWCGCRTCRSTTSRCRPLR